MYRSRLAAALAVALAGACAPEIQEASSLDSMVDDLMSDFEADVEQVREKLMGLANAIPEESWDWRPGEGVRSVGEVFLHVAADNFYIPIAMGTAAPESTGIMAGDYETVRTYERRDLPRDEIVAELTASFDHLAMAMEADAHSDMAREIDLFGSMRTAQASWVLTVTHLHEHLGQMIAYARTNGVVPPWSM